MRLFRPTVLAGLLAAVGMAGWLAPTPAAAQAAPDESPWIKICNTDPQASKEVCLITQELRTPQGQFLASFAIREIEGQGDRLVLVSVPVGMLLQQGVVLQVDGADPVRATYQICFPNACYAELRVQGDYITKLKRGRVLRIVALNQQAQQVPFEMTLIGFTAVYDGPGLNPQQLQARNQELEQELNRRAAEARERLIEAQRQAGSGTAN